MFSCFDTIPACDGQRDGRMLQRHSSRYAQHRAVKTNHAVEIL